MIMRFLVAVALAAASVVSPAQQSSVPAPAIDAKAHLLVDFHSGQSLASHNANERVEPASLTKLMTAYLTFTALGRKTLQPEQAVVVSERAWRAEGSRMFIEPHRPVTVNELIRGMIVQSGNLRRSCATFPTSTRCIQRANFATTIFPRRTATGCCGRIPRWTA
jgi:D-alanyl-D-alanine carboxypeptidase (penicillin-binding protein 5/6)